MTLEVLPPIPIDKGSAVRRLLLHRHIAASLYAGDDTTDIDAFRVVDVAVAVRLGRDAAGPGRGGARSPSTAPTASTAAARARLAASADR